MSARIRGDEGATWSAAREGPLAVVVVNHGSSELLRRNLAAHDPRPVADHVVVVDNHTTEAEAEAVRDLAHRMGWHLVALPQNVGFGAGMNAGVARAQALGCTSFLLLNPDARIEPEVLAELHRDCVADPLRMLAPRIVRDDGTTWFEGAVLRVDRGITSTAPGSDSSAANGWLTGACLIVHRDLWDRMGGFDEAYFLYWEDIELSWRCRQVGGRLGVRSDVSVVHSVGGTQHATGKSSAYVYYNCRNRMIFAGSYLPRRTMLAWLTHAPNHAWRVVQRGGRRALLRRPLPLIWAALRGTAAGAGIALRHAPRRPGERRAADHAVSTDHAEPSRPAEPSPKVLVAHPSADLFGSDRMVLESVEGLLAGGNDVIVTLPRGGPLVDELERRGVRVRYCPTPVLRRSLLRPLGSVTLVVESLRGLVAGLRLMLEERPDVVYVSTVTLPLWLVLARLTRRPSIAHVHEAEQSAHPAVRRALATPLLLAHAVLANSAYCVEVVSGVYPALRDRTVVVPNGIQGPDRPAASRERLDGTFRVAYVGRLSARKGVDTAITAVAALRAAGVDATLEIAGSPAPGGEEVVRALHELADDPALQGAVRFLGYRDAVWPVLAHCDVLVVPSRMEEGFGNTAVEGALAARPVVVSDTSGLREASAGFRSMQRVVPGDAAALRDALGAVIDDWSGFRALAADDRIVAAGRHDPARYRTSIATAAATVRTTAGRSSRASSPWRGARGPLLAAMSESDGPP